MARTWRKRPGSSRPPCRSRRPFATDTEVGASISRNTNACPEVLNSDTPDTMDLDATEKSFERSAAPSPSLSMYDADSSTCSSPRSSASDFGSSQGPGTPATSLFGSLVSSDDVGNLADLGGMNDGTAWSDEERQQALSEVESTPSLLEDDSDEMGPGPESVGSPSEDATSAPLLQYSLYDPAEPYHRIQPLLDAVSIFSRLYTESPSTEVHTNVWSNPALYLQPEWTQWMPEGLY